eukprot:gene11216-2141_t
MDYDAATKAIVGFGLMKPKPKPPHNCSASNRSSCGAGPAGVANKTACDALKCCWDTTNNWCFTDHVTPPYLRSVVEFDTESHEFREVCTVQGWYNLEQFTDITVAAFDSNNRVLYGILQQDGYASAPYALVGIELATCKTIVTKGPWPPTRDAVGAPPQPRSRLPRLCVATPGGAFPCH